MYFKSRIQAAQSLAEALEKYRGSHPLVLAIPRGGIPLGKVIADQLEGDLDVVLVHKIGAPENPEFAVGSVSEFGTLYISEAARLYGIPLESLEQTAQSELEKLKRRRESYSPIRPPINPEGRVAILVDDGIATGATMLAAVRAIRSKMPHRIVVASPVVSPEAANTLRQEADEVITLAIPEHFFSISQFYEEFPQVSDEEVLHILASA